MRTLRTAGAVVLGLLMATGWAGQAWGWGDLGHRIVCEIAFQQLIETAKREVTRLIRTDPDFTLFRDACIWPDHPRKRASEHFINAPRDLARFPDARCPMAPTCLFSAINADLVVLRTSTNDQAKLESLKFLGHWVSDIHQPLHVSFEDDRGGNQIRAAGPCSGDNLHAVWDTCIIQRGLGDSPTAVAQTLPGEITPGQRASWTATPLVGWANESFFIARMPSVQYCVRVGTKCVYALDNEEFTQGEMERVVTVDGDYITMHAPLVAARLKQAGARLAHLFNTTLGR